MATGDVFEAEYRIKRTDGEYRWFLGRAVPIRDEAGMVCEWLGTATDIHDRKLVEERESLIQRKVAQLQSTATELAKPHSPAEIAKIVLQSIFQMLSPDVGCIVLLESDRFRVVNSRGFDAQTIAVFEKEDPRDLPVWEAVRTRRPLIVT